MNLRETIKNHFKLHGFVLETNAITNLTEIFGKIESGRHNKVFEKIICHNRTNLSNNKINVGTLKKAVNVCRKDKSSLISFQVIDSLHAILG